jgi:NitT/TauT family transport system substrate-binding protein
MESNRTQTARYVALAAAAFAALGACGAAAQEKITFNMSWLPQGSVIGPVVAVERGWFKEAGLDVNIVRGYGGNRTANELDQGQFEVGYVDPISLVLNRSNGGKIKLVGAINTKWPGGICYVTSRVQAKSIDDLKGRVLGGGSASPVHNVVPAWLELNGKPKDLVRMLRMDPAVVDASLIEGKIDLAECWRASNRAITQKQAAAAGVQVAWIEYSDFGLNAYGSGFAVREAYLAQKPDVVRKFLRASYRGYEYAMANPEQAADLMVKAFPTVDRAVALQQIREIGELIVDPDVRQSGLGFQREDRMRSTIGFLEKAFDLKSKVQVGDIYTNELLK